MNKLFLGEQQGVIAREQAVRMSVVRERLNRILGFVMYGTAVLLGYENASTGSFDAPVL